MLVSMFAANGKYRFVEFFRYTHHFFVHFPRLISVRENKLFNLFKLMNPEYTPGFFAVRSSFFSKTGGVSSVLAVVV